MTYAPYKYFNDIEKPCALIFQQMQNRGICIDLDYLQTLKSKLEESITPIKDAIHNELGQINLNSPRQLLKALNEKNIYPKLKGKSSTDKRALEFHRANPVIQLLLKYSEFDTLLSSFVYPYLERNTEIVYPFFNQCGTRTGRPSCSNPNLLQIPKRTDNGKLVRGMFKARHGKRFGDCDFGQIEPRVLAHLSKDQVLCKLFNDGVDFHTYTAERLSIDRERAKVLNLSVGYRATFRSVMAQLRCTKDEAQKQIDAWWSLFPNLRRWEETLIYESRRSGFCITILGRRIKVDGLTESNSWKREAAERQLINNITQGSAAEIMKLSMIKVSQSQKLSMDFGLLVQVYDELLAESSNMEQDIEVMKECMETSIKLEVPLVVDAKTGLTWEECH